MLKARCRKAADSSNPPGRIEPRATKCLVQDAVGDPRYVRDINFGLYVVEPQPAKPVSVPAGTRPGGEMKRAISMLGFAAAAFTFATVALVAPSTGDGLISATIAVRAVEGLPSLEHALA